MHSAQDVVNATLANSRVMIQENMNESYHWLIRGILCIFARQTADEQSVNQTKWHNGVGFGAVDAEILSSFAKQIENGRTLSQRQIEVARKCMRKYAMQLARIAREKRVNA